MAMNVDNTGKQSQLNLLQQGQNAQGLAENLEVSQEQMKQEKIRRSTEDIRDSLVDKHLGTNKSGNQGLDVTHFSPLRNGETALDPALLDTLFSSGKLDISQGLGQTGIEGLMFLTQNEVTLQELFFFVGFIVENDELKTKLSKLLALLDKLITSGNDGEAADILLFGGLVSENGEVISEKLPTQEEIIASLFADWEKRVDEAMKNEVTEQEDLPEPKPFLINIFDKAVLFALLLVEINRTMRESFNDIKQSLTTSKDAINEAAIAGILERGIEALASGITASASQLAMTVGGAGMQARASKQSTTTLKAHQTQAPNVKQEITDLKGQVHSGKLNHDAPEVQTKSSLLGEKEAELDALDINKDIDLKRSETLQNWGMAVQSGSQGAATFVNSIGEQQTSMTEASNRASEQASEVLTELFRAIAEAVQQQKVEQDAAVQLLKDLREADASIYASVRM